MSHLEESTWTQKSVPRRKPKAGLSSISRRILFSRMETLENGTVSFVEDGARHVFGSSTPDRLGATVWVHDPRFYLHTIARGSLGAAHAYIQGYWGCDNLTNLARILVRNQSLSGEMEGGFSRLVSLFDRVFHWHRRNTRAGSRRNIADHYDLGNDFFALFLDETMSYSCGFFEVPSSSMQQASLGKLDLVCEKLDLSPQDHVLEIGSGWGGFAMHAARRCGCRVTSTTISQQQYVWARRAVQEAGLADRVTILRRDYRDLEGAFDKLASIEMIEAVGHQFLDLYFTTCSGLLKPGGRMLLQTITLADRYAARALKSVDFTQRYIFPGSAVPSLSRIFHSVAESKLEVRDLEDLTEHYPPTLRSWCGKFLDNMERVRALGYPQSLIRMWEFYFCYCEAGFLERHIGDFQILLSKPEY